MNWYYKNKGKKVGPISEGEFEQLCSTKVIKGDTMVWNSALDNWMPMRELASTLKDKYPPPPFPKHTKPVTKTKCGGEDLGVFFSFCVNA